jgi:hypothetical protein
MENVKSRAEMNLTPVSMARARKSLIFSGK